MYQAAWFSTFDYLEFIGIDFQTELAKAGIINSAVGPVG